MVLHDKSEVITLHDEMKNSSQVAMIKDAEQILDSVLGVQVCTFIILKVDTKFHIPSLSLLQYCLPVFPVLSLCPPFINP